MTSLRIQWRSFALGRPAGAAQGYRRPPLKTRLARAASLLALFSMLCFSLAATAQGRARPRIDFVYFGSPECSFCRGWEAADLPKLKQSALFRQVRFTKIAKAIGSPVPQAASFPDEIKSLREPIAAKLAGAGSPMFAILNEGKVVEAWRGSKKYSPDQILEIIGQQQAQMFSGPNRKPAVHSAVARKSRAAPLTLSAAPVAR